MNRFAMLCWSGPRRLLLALALALAVTMPAFAQQDNPEAASLLQRLDALDSHSDYTGVGVLERLYARQAIDVFLKARRSEIATALQVAQWRVEAAELAAQTGAVQRQIQALGRERSELLLEASRREAIRARQEAERLRIQAQIQAEEAERLRLAVESEAQARQEAEGVLESVANAQVERARAARQRAARLKAQEEELRRQLQEEDQ